MSLEDVPSALADALAITESTAQVIISIAVIFALLLPTMYLAKGKNAITIYIIVVFIGECLLVGLGWMPFWILITTLGCIALAIAAIGAQAVTGE